MRTIKFRGKRLDNSQWIIGSHTFIQDADGIWLEDENLDVVKVIPETLGQFTGLTDKNGKDIYEGDILHERVAIRIVDRRIVKFCYGSFIAESTYNQGAQCYGAPHEKFQSLKYLSVNDIKIEVVGNIHDNSEFLKGGLL